MTLRETMQQHLALARGANATECRESIAGVVTQSDGMRAEGKFGPHVVIVDEPTIFGGHNTAANPAEVLLAALATSVSVTLRCHAALLGLNVGRIQVDVKGDLDIRGFFDTDPTVRSGFQSITLKLQIESSATSDDLKALLAAARRGCPMLDTCRDATPIDIELSL